MDSMHFLYHPEAAFYEKNTAQNVACVYSAAHFEK
jgi:hypothetical protein